MICVYPYCRALRDDPHADCPRCGWPADPTREGWATALADALPPLGPILDLHAILPAGDAAAPAQLAWMERLDVKLALFQSAPPQMTSLQGDRALVGLARQLPTRIRPSAFLDPRDPRCLDAIPRLAEARVRVATLLPVTGWDPADPAFHPFWDALQAHRVVALVHTGFVTARHVREEAAAGVFLDSRLGDPLHLDPVCRRFPDLGVVLSHTGGAVFVEQAAEMVSQHPNVWGDLSASGLFALQRLLRGAAVDWSKLFWGNDSVADAYPVNLRLLLSALEGAGAERLLRPLLHHNGARFAERWL